MQITFENVFVEFELGDKSTRSVLNDFSFAFESAKVTAIVGRNGSGKSTLLNVAAHLCNPKSGRVSGAESLFGQPNGKGCYLWQDYRSSLFPWFNVESNISLPLRLASAPKEIRSTLALKVLKELLPELFGSERIYTLSGGQQQLVALARSMVVRPMLLLADEPLSALDQSRSWSCLRVFEKFWMESPFTALWISHNIDEALLVSDYLLLFDPASKTQVVLRNQLARPRIPSALSCPWALEAKSRIIEHLAPPSSKEK